VARLSEFVLEGTVRLSFGPHSERARADAELLLMHVLGRDRAWILAHREETLSDPQAQQYLELLERRHRGEPIQYIVGEVEFYGLPLKVSPAVLIPRPETEHLVEKVLGLLPHFSNPRIVDVGTGSGAIAIALAHEWPRGAITAIDTSAAALDLARVNAERIGFASRIRFLRGDLLEQVSGEQFDVVVSNPPYVPATDRDSLSVEVRDYEPAVALFAGHDGLDIYRRLIPAARAALVPGGFVALEIGCGQAQAVEGLLNASGFENVEFAPDLQGIPRVASAQHV
jgi:release factor glutamine methyltransferase